MASPYSTTAHEPRATPQPRQPSGNPAVWIIADAPDAVVRAYQALLLNAGESVRFIPASDVSVPDGLAASVVIFPGNFDLSRAFLERVFAALDPDRDPFVAIVSTFKVHFGDTGSERRERQIAHLARLAGARTAVFRPSHLLGKGTAVSAMLYRLGPIYPLVPASLRGCCIEMSELFAAIERERTHPRHHAPRHRTFTLPGPNLPWRQRLAEHHPCCLASRLFTGICWLLSFLMIGHLAAAIVRRIIRLEPAWRHWNFDTLEPASFKEMLELYNTYSHSHFKAVGYNNGVNHFGHLYLGKTVLSTVQVHRVRRVGPALIKVDAGATIRRTLDFLAPANQDLFVVPNYSYVCLGTAFFVPIHGSASDYSCVAETFTRVVLFDPIEDRIVAADREDSAFRERVYDTDSPVMLLRLYCKVKPRASFFMKAEQPTNPSADDLLAALRDSRAANVEVRKAKTSDDFVKILRFYKDAGSADGSALELPRDQLGRLWDRLEENPLTSYLMHALGRKILWHVELFFTAEEFATFWRTHTQTPLRKMQFRYIRRDGMPRSHFRDHDCISVDTFMMRGKRQEFEAYLSKTFAVIRLNPGKHSR